MKLFKNKMFLYHKHVQNNLTSLHFHTYHDDDLIRSVYRLQKNSGRLTIAFNIYIPL